MATKEMNVYQKLLKAREMFLANGTRKSGKNMALEFKYFELEDIVPMATKIFSEVGLISLVSYSNDVAMMTIVNTENSEQRIDFCSPMRTPETNRGVNPMQALGAAHTYLRRYLYMMVLDIVEADAIEPTLTKETTETVKTPTPAPVPKAKKPATTTERAEIKKEITNAEGMADELQITAIKGAFKKLISLDPTKEGFVRDVMTTTDNLAKLSRSSAETLILKINEVIAQYPSEE